MATCSEVWKLLRQWDKGSNLIRETMLKEFSTQCTNDTASEIELYFDDCASLFLARLMAWLRLTYMVGTCLDLQLRAIGIFLSSASGHYFLVEFLEVGGLLTILEVIRLKSSKDNHIMEAIKLLITIIVKGRQYKELLCESHGLKVVSECLALSPSVQVQECAADLLLQLSTGNPNYQTQIYNVLITLLSSTSHEAQQKAAFCIRQILTSISSVGPQIIDPALQLLKSLHVDVQCEAAELLKVLVGYKDVQQTVLVELVRLLKPSENSGSLAQSCTVPLPMHIQQAGAAKVIGLLVVSNQNVTRQLLELGVVHHLIYTIGNTMYPDSQRQAALSLFALSETFDTVKQEVNSIFGEDLFEKFMDKQENFYSILTPAQVDVMISSLRHDRNTSYNT